MDNAATTALSSPSPSPSAAKLAELTYTHQRKKEKTMKTGTDALESLVTALRALKPRCSDRYGVSKLRTKGIFLVNCFRYQEDADAFAALVEAAGGDVFEIRKVGKVEITDGGRATLPIRVIFSIGIDADLYLAGKITIHDLRRIDAESRA